MNKNPVKTPLIYALEPRLLFDGDLGADVASAIVYRDGNATDTAPAVAPENQRETQRENISFEFHSTRGAIVFIDGGVEDPQTLADA
ncbi:LEPR-XLL domain-containing protein, partial [Alphaproteobacteria bacterium]|nr:LEPR-XLL domain-containing protein [Alphaproteobacteria bacterium]MDB2462377.1 LEPR-XLL domain-containing protein [Alphaproteobacteria bacterium]MDB2477911.1 LEPR-XLL domain-containing protein [Alphaproteobacteria bacterium]MDB2488767.1 LEPR-XLL domain-containing protein [Alphaproteobacteria bacterium]MDB2536957.1 LEPR-XLL domain-containing protein [Alphaproteobacteria bacterium]